MQIKFTIVILAVGLSFYANAVTTPQIDLEAPKVPNIASQSIQGYAEGQVLLTFGENQWKSFDNIIKRESSWKHTAKNPKSSAVGLCQTMYSLHKDGLVDDFLDNPEAQIDWCVKYAKERYGDPNSAWKFWQKNKYW